MRGLERPPWWAIAVIALGIVGLAVEIPIAMHRSRAQASSAVAPLPTAPTATSSVAPRVMYAPPNTAALMDTFSGGTGQSLRAAATGQKWTLTGSNPLVLTNAGMTINGTGAGYTAADLGKAPASLGAAVTFAPGKPGAVVAMLVSAGPGLDLNNMGVHYYFDSTGWTIQVREGGQTPFPTLRGGKFNPPLKTDGTTVYTANVAISGDTLTITNADGTTVQVTDPRVGKNLSGNVAWEVFRTVADQEQPAFRQVWATTP